MYRNTARKYGLLPNFLLNANVPYSQAILGIKPTNIVGYWPLNEKTGTTINDLSGHNYSGTYTGVTLAQTPFLDNTLMGSWDGTDDSASVFGSGLASAFPSTLGTFACWVKIPTAGWVTGDGKTRVCFRFEANSNNVLQIDTLSSTRALRFIHIAGSTAKISQASTFTNNTGWLALTMVWDKANDSMRAYVNGATFGTNQTGLGVWASTLTVASLGSSIANSQWLGSIAHACLWNVALTAGEINTYYMAA